jgi:thiol-disulfide isomerase/thioredoxin
MKWYAMKWWAIIFAAGLAWAQTPAAPQPNTSADQQAAEQKEQVELSQAIAEAGTSNIDFIRALERHLAKYPDTKQRAAIEKGLAKSAIDANDHARIILYGERVLQAEPNSDDLSLIDRVIRALLDTDDPESAKKALSYIGRYQSEVEKMRGRASEGHMSEGQWAAEIDKAMARVLLLAARATGNSGNPEAALGLARSAWQTSPTAEGAREIAKWLVKLDQGAQAVEFYADAFAMEDPRTTEADRARDRTRLGELYTKLNGSEKGLGDQILAAYDRTAALKRDRLAALKLKDPNAGASELIDFTLAPVEKDKGGPVALASLKGKTVVMDFWATWCGPCKVQHPLIEKIKSRYEKSGNVVFLSVDSDEDHSLVAPFLAEMHWSGRNFFESGLTHLLNVSAIPTVIVLDKDGKISSRMSGFIPERFEEMLTQRIDETHPETRPN